MWLWCGVVWCGVVWCGVVWCGVVWCGVVWCGVVWCVWLWCVCGMEYCVGCGEPAGARARGAHLGGDAHGAGVGVALAHHDAADGDQRRGAEAKLLRAQQRRYRDVAPGLHLAVSLRAGRWVGGWVGGQGGGRAGRGMRRGGRWEGRWANWRAAAGSSGRRAAPRPAAGAGLCKGRRRASKAGSAHLQHRAPAQVVGHQRLVRLGQAQLPGQACVLDGGPLGGAGAAVVAADEHVVCVALDHAWRGGAGGSGGWAGGRVRAGGAGRDEGGAGRQGLGVRTALPPANDTSPPPATPGGLDHMPRLPWLRCSCSLQCTSATRAVCRWPRPPGSCGRLPGLAIPSHSCPCSPFRCGALGCHLTAGCGPASCQLPAAHVAAATRSWQGRSPPQVTPSAGSGRAAPASSSSRHG